MKEVCPLGDILSDRVTNSPACLNGLQRSKPSWARASREIAPLVHIQEYLPSPGDSGPESWTKSSPAQRPRRLPRKPESDLSNLANKRRFSAKVSFRIGRFFFLPYSGPGFFLTTVRYLQGSIKVPNGKGCKQKEVVPGSSRVQPHIETTAHSRLLRL